MPEPTEPASQPELQKPIGEFVQKTADEVRKQPVKSLVWAFFVGIFLTILPVGRLLRIVTAIVFALIRPVLLLLGAVKLCEEIEMRRK
jgi:RsiW-degrading membrane proteinase PrsW (M82 family)